MICKVLGLGQYFGCGFMAIMIGKELIIRTCDYCLLQNRV